MDEAAYLFLKSMDENIKRMDEKFDNIVSNVNSLGIDIAEVKVMTKDVAEKATHLESKQYICQRDCSSRIDELEKGYDRLVSFVKWSGIVLSSAAGLVGVVAALFQIIHS